MTYSEKVPVMVRSKIIDRPMAMMKKGNLVEATMTWNQAYFSVVMPGLLQLPTQTQGETGKWGRKSLPPQAPTLKHQVTFVWKIFRDMSVPHGGSLYPHLGVSVYMAAQASGDTVFGSTCLLSQHEVPSCLPP